MNEADGWLKDELLQASYKIIDDFKNGIIHEETFKERLLTVAERYERRFVGKELTAKQKDLF